MREGAAEPYLKIESLDRKGDGGSGGELKSDMHRWGGGGRGEIPPPPGGATLVKIMETRGNLTLCDKFARTFQYFHLYM